MRPRLFTLLATLCICIGIVLSMVLVPKELPSWIWWLPYSLVVGVPIVGIVSGIRRERRQQLRREHGLCVSCGYDLRASPHRCPECGRETSQRAFSDV